MPESLLSSAEWDQVVRSLRLSSQQARIVGLILQGKQDKEIAAAMELSIWTVRTQLTRLFQRLDVGGRVGLVLHAFRIVHQRGE